MICECEKAGFCPRYQREMAGRLLQICKGENIDAGEAEKYRQLWLSQAGMETRPALACPHFGPELRDDEGHARTRECPTCPDSAGKPQRLKLHVCTHPALEPNEVTPADCQQCPYAPRDTTSARKLLLKNHLCPGDVLCMTAAIHSLHRAHPGTYLTAVETTCQAVFEHNPDVVPVGDGFETVQMHYPAVQQCNQRAIHQLAGYT